MEIAPSLHGDWRSVVTRARADAKSDNLPLLAAGIAFYALLALVPALVAFVSIYGLIANPADVARHVNDVLGASPREVRTLIDTQLEAITNGKRSQAGLGALLGVLFAFWSASSGMSHAIEGVNAAYNQKAQRGVVRLRLLALALTVGAMAFGLLAMLLIAVAPAVVASSSVGAPFRIVLSAARWPLLAAGMLAALAVFYRFAPEGRRARWRWLSPGAIVATSLWLAGSALFSIYTANFGRYNETYGSLGAIVVVMLWLFLTGFVVLFGAELNAAAERKDGRA
jgi:membrane protein